MTCFAIRLSDPVELRPVPSLVDEFPYAGYTVLTGDESDGVPEPLGSGGDSERKPLRAPNGAVTYPYRKA